MDALTSDLLTVVCLHFCPSSVGTEAHVLLVVLDKSVIFGPEYILIHFAPVSFSELFKCGGISLKAPFASYTLTGRQPPAHISVVGSVCEKHRVALNILAGAPTFINLSCQMPSVHPQLTPVFSASAAAIKGSVLWLFDGESWPDTLCSC